MMLVALLCDAFSMTACFLPWVIQQASVVVKGVLIHVIASLSVRDRLPFLLHLISEHNAVSSHWSLEQAC